jgi:hypothetical protein
VRIIDIFSNPHIHAKQVGLECQKSVHVFLFTGTISNLIPIKMKSRSQDSFTFIDSISMRIVPVSHKSPCHEFRYQIISLGGQLLEVDQITASVREIRPAP